MKNSAVIKLDDDGNAVIPARLLKHLNLAEGQSLCVLQEDQCLTVLPEAELEFRGHPYANWRDISHDLLEAESG